MIKAINISNNNIIGDKITIADNFFTKFIGLLNKKYLNTGEGLLIKNCNSIHSIGMKFNFDAVFLDNDNKVVFVRENIPSCHILPIIFKARHVLELPLGTIKNTNTQVGNQIEFI